MVVSQAVALTYEGLPLSSGSAHTLRIGRRPAFDATMSFLSGCTIPVGPIGFSFAVQDVPGSPARRDHEEALERRFGRGRRVLLSDPDEAADALNLLDEIDPQPANQWGMSSVWFEIRAKFLLADPMSGEPVVGQTESLFDGLGFRNKLCLTLDTRARLQIELCIPGPTEALLSQVIPNLQSHLPCKLSQKHWRQWSVTSRATLRPRKADVTPYL